MIRQVEPDQDMVRNFVDMGFQETRSKRVLKHFLNNFEAAMAHMLNNDETSDNIIIGREENN